MEIKKKLLYIYTISLILVISSLVIFARFVFYAEFETLENKKISTNNEIVRKEILKDLGTLSFKNMEWASRESNYSILKEKRYLEFEKSLNLSALRNQGIDLIIYGDTKSFINGYNLATDQDNYSAGLQALAKSLLKKFSDNETIRDSSTVLEIFNFGESGSWLISQKSITDRYGLEESVGRLILGKKLDESYFNKLSEKLAIKVFYKGIESTFDNTSYKVHDSIVTDYGLELNSGKYFVFSIIHSPEILMAGQSSFRLFFITSSLMIIFIMGFTYISLQRSIFSPMLTIQEEVSNIDINNLQEIKVKNKTKEITTLIDTINTLIKRVRSDYELLSHKSKLESLGLMAGGIAHEINNPLTILKSNSSIMLRELSTSDSLLDKKISLKLQKNIKTIDRIASIITGLQKISRQSSQDDLVKIDANVILSNLKDLTPGIIESIDINVDYKYSEHPLHFKGLEQQVTQALINLMVNSSHAIKDDSAPWMRIELEEKSGFIIFRVIDSGHGIPEDIQERLMDPFFTTKQVGEGTGLGLSICRKIAHFHGGDLKLSTVAQNTTFELSIPILKDDGQVVA